MTDREGDTRALGVLARALGSTSRVTRLRAVSMLALVECDQRIPWLETACSDADVAVAQTARVVLSWIVNPPKAPWPQREDPSFDRLGGPSADEVSQSPFERALRWKWEYVVEIWREDGLLIGAFLAPTCEEDDEHAKRIALGQAILANAGAHGEEFDAGTAAAFIVGKRRLVDGPDSPGRSRRDSGRGRAQ